jgi:predicted NBD/HSP70 family sugar kinase
LSRTQITSGDALNRSRGVAAEELRRHNLATVLERLHISGPTSRSDLAATTGLNRSTIADLIGELTALGLAEEGPGLAASGPGRPSPMVRTRPHGAAVLAIELSVDSIAVATVGLGGHVYNQLRIARPRGHFSPQETVQDVAKLAEPLLASLPAKHVLAGVGAGVVGIARRSDGFVHFAPNLGWRNVPLGAMLASELGLSGQVQVANEADLGALAEYRRGVGSGVGHLIYISGEAGIGAGIIQDGKPMLGSAGYAGEAGHTLINPNGQRCRCGAIGCWETEAGEAALARHAGIPVTVVGLGVLDAVMARARAGEERTLAAIEEIGRWLGLGIGNLINVFNPELVVLGGFYQALFPFLEESVIEGARLRALDAPGAVATITSSGLGSDAPLIGAAELALSEVIADPARTAGRSVRIRPPVEDKSGG